MIDNNKYVKADVVYQRLTQTIKNKTIQFYDIVEWCAQCELEEIGQVIEFFEHRDVDLTIADYQAALPVGCWRIQAVKRNESPVDYISNGNYLNFKKNYTNVKIDYLSIPLDAETGLPLIIRGHEAACYFYCLKNLYMEDYLEGRIDQNRWNTIERNYDQAIALIPSRTSTMSRNDRIKVLDAMKTVIYNYRNLKVR